MPNPHRSRAPVFSLGTDSLSARTFQSAKPKNPRDEIPFLVERPLKLLPPRYVCQPDREHQSSVLPRDCRSAEEVKRIKLGMAAYPRLLRRVLNRDDWRCQTCGAVKDLQVHHRKHLSQLGDDSLDNLVTLCAYCHLEFTVSWPIPKRLCGKWAIRSHAGSVHQPQEMASRRLIET